ncbi:MAG TPA: hypothetical protein VGJ28_02400 [Micromonosporaceae bacterium]|jgi:hypothetical protein
MTDDLPFVDEHDIVIAAARDRVWAEVRRYADTSLATFAHRPLVRLLGAEPGGAFTVTRESRGECLELTGRHRFARYRLEFGLVDVADGGTRLSARTYAAFPGPYGRVYRALLLGTRGHVIAVRRMLRSVRRNSLG